MKALRLRAGFVALTGLALICGATFGASVALADQGDFEAAMADYAAGRYEEALGKLRSYVESNPGEEEVYAVLRAADEKVLLRVLTQQGEHERLLNYLWERARPAARQDRADPSEIAAIVEEALSSDLDRRINAGMRLKAVGELAVPALLPHLASPEAETVVYAMFALERIGPDATLALSEALRSEDARLRGFVAATLGDIRDGRGVAALLRTKETDTDEGVREKAIKALRKIGGDRAVSINGANAFTRMGARFYANDPAVVTSFDTMHNIWRWENGELARYEVPSYLYRFQIAEQCAVDALALDPGHRAAKSLLVRSLMAQKVEADVIRSNGGDAPESLAGAFDLAASQGFQAASDALASSLRIRDWDVAIECMALLQKTYGREKLGNHPLGAALVAPERRVRYHAAITALMMSPKGGMANADKVAPLAAQAASEEALRQVLVIDDRDDTRARLVMDLAHAGYVAAGESSGAAGVNRAKLSPMMDVIVVRADLGDHADTIPSRRHTSSLMVIDELLSDARTRDMRILVLLQDTPEAQTAALQSFFENKYGESVKGFITVPIDTTSAMEAVTAAAEAGNLNPDRERANELAARAAHAFAVTDFSCMTFNLKVAVEPLVTAATNGPTAEVKMNAVNALGNIRKGGSDALMQILKEGDSEELRAAAAGALGSVLSVLEGSDEHVEALIEAAQGEGAVAEAALQALGKVKRLSPEQRLKIFRDHRLQVPSRAGS